MIKDAMAENAETTPNSRELAVLKEHFPGYFRKDGSFDVARFSDEVLRANGASPSQEGFGLDFLGRNYAKLIASLETETVIVPDEAHNSLPENKDSRNVYVTGDNLDALKHLLKSYSGQVKCIYIDPPYNTGKDDFLYNDTFKFSVDDLEAKLGVDTEQACKILEFTSKGSCSHSAWLTFMLPRLQLARNLLLLDGVVFVSIDDNEQATLRLLCDQVFGEENFVGCIVWNNVTDNNPTNIAVEHEYIVCYSKNKAALSPVWQSKDSDVKEILLNLEADILARCGDDVSKAIAEYSQWYSIHKKELGAFEGYKFIDSGGIYAGSRSVHNPGKKGYYYDVLHPQRQKPCTPPLLGYRFPPETMKELLAKGKIIFGEDETKIIELKQSVREYSEKMSSVLVLDGRSGANTIRALFDNENVFKNPKSEDLLEYLLSFSIAENDVVLDLFGGSSTTAHAVLNMNAKDGGNRRYIMVQWPEAVKENSEAAKAGYKTIDEIGQERIKRAAKKIREENPLFAGDLGFKHYTLKAVPQDTLDKLEVFDPEKEILEDATILAAFGKDTVLETWLVKDGYGFAADVKPVKLKDYTAYWCGRHLYLIEPGFTQDDVAELFKRYDTEGAFSPDHVALFGYSFAAWSVREMLEINLRQLKDGAKNLQVNIDTRY